MHPQRKIWDSCSSQCDALYSVEFVKFKQTGFAIGCLQRSQHWTHVVGIFTLSFIDIMTFYQLKFNSNNNNTFQLIVIIILFNTNSIIILSLVIKWDTCPQFCFLNNTSSYTMHSCNRVFSYGYLSTCPYFVSYSVVQPLMCRTDIPNVLIRITDSWDCPIRDTTDNFR